MSTHVVTASREQVDWAISMMDSVGELIEMSEDSGKPIEINDGAGGSFARANAILTAVSITAFGLTDQVESLRAEIVSLQAALDKTRERLSDAEEEIRKVDNWAKAYPVDVFPEPNLERCKRLLEDGGESIDCLAAYARRGAIEWIGQGVKAYFAKYSKPDNSTL